MKRVFDTSLELSLLSGNVSKPTDTFFTNYNQNKLIYMKSLSLVCLCHKAIKFSILFFAVLVLTSNVSWCQNTNPGLPSLYKGGNNNRLTMSLYKDVDNVSISQDVTIAVFDNSFSKDIGPEDANKMMNGAENIYINQGGTALCIDGLPIPLVNEVIQLNMSNLQRDSVYQLIVDAAMFSVAGLKPYIIDNYLNTEVIASTVISFTPTSNAATYQNRFSVVFRPDGALGTNFTSFVLHNEGNFLRVDWYTATETNLKMYVVEKSFDGINFTKQIALTPYNAIAANYGWLDLQSPETDIYYRIKAISIDGTFTYSNIVKYTFIKHKSPIKLYPNPAIDQITVSYNKLTDVSKLSVYNLLGNKVATDNLVIGSSEYSLNVSSLSAGTYIAEIITKNDRITSIFIKK